MLLTHLFQSTLPREERLGSTGKVLFSIYFNPRSHERSDIHSSVAGTKWRISIHAPTRGATGKVCGQYNSAQDFNPRSHERSDHNAGSICCQYGHFNPRSHERSDDALKCMINNISYFNPRSHERSDNSISKWDLFKSISIHAPTRGATRCSCDLICLSRFQSTLPREERQSATQQPTTRALFQSTLPREERRKPKRKLHRRQNFNPRSHERSDAVLPLATLWTKIFQSTLPREERQQYCTKNLFIFIQYRQ